jgi:nucleoside 2-deoxyribosyltransferase
MNSVGRRPKRLRRTAPHLRVYCAGPFFNRAEQVEMAEIAAALEGAGFRTFLPQRDGFVFAKVRRELLQSGYDASEAGRMVQSAIFRLDVFEVVHGCQGLVVNLNGRVPDEGGVAEAAMAWMAGKPLVLYKSDSRSLLHGYDNALVAGLGEFVAVSTIPEVAYAFTQIFRRRTPEHAGLLPPPVRAAAECGRRLSAALAAAKSPEEVTAAIIAATRLATAKPTR